MNRILNESILGPMEVPILKGIGREEITTFMMQYERYETVRDSRVRMGKKIPLLSKLLCVEPSLLKTLAKYELGSKSVEEVTEKELEVYLNRCLQPTDGFPPNLTNIFRKLKFDDSKDSRARVVKFFKDADLLIKFNGLGEIPEKVITKYFIQRIQPKALKRLVERAVEFRGKKNFRTRVDLFPLILNYAEGLDFFGKELDKEREKFPGRRKGNVKKRRAGLECHGCGLKHLLRDCPTCSSAEKERIWRERLEIVPYPSEESARKFFAEDSDEQDNNIEESARMSIVEEMRLPTEIINPCGDEGLVAEGLERAAAEQQRAAAAEEERTTATARKQQAAAAAVEQLAAAEWCKAEAQSVATVRHVAVQHGVAVQHAVVVQGAVVVQCAVMMQYAVAQRATAGNRAPAAQRKAEAQRVEEERRVEEQRGPERAAAHAQKRKIAVL